MNTSTSVQNAPSPAVQPASYNAVRKRQWRQAYEEQIVKDNLAKYPQFQTAIDQLHASKSSQATQGAVMGVFPEARQIVEGAIEEVLSGSETTKQALDTAAETITSKIATYNKTTQK